MLLKRIADYFFLPLFCLALFSGYGNLAGAQTAKKAAASSKKINRLTQGEWARQLVKRLRFINDPEAYAMADKELYTLLSGRGEGEIIANSYKKSLFPAKIIQSDNIQNKEVDWVEAVKKPTTLYYFLPIPVAGKYRFKILTKGPSKQYWNFQGEDNIRTVNSSAEFSWVAMKPFTLRAGIKRLGASIPVGGAVQRINYSGPCAPAIEPQGGWKPKEKIDYAQMVRTLVMAYANVLEEKKKEVLAKDKSFKPQQFGPTKYSVGQDKKRRSVYLFKLKKSGIYTIYSEQRKPGNRHWKINACGLLETNLEASAEEKAKVVRQHITTQYFKSGRQEIEVYSDSGIVDDTLVILRNDDKPKTYLDLVKELGLPTEEDFFEALADPDKNAIDDFFEPIDDLLGYNPPAPPALPDVPPYTGGDDGRAGDDPDNPFQDDDRGAASPIVP